MIAVRMRAARKALERLAPEARALLDLSIRRGLEDADIASVLRVDTKEVERRRDAALEALAADLRLRERWQRDELLATLPDLPPDYWRAQGLVGKPSGDRRRGAPDGDARV